MKKPIKSVERSNDFTKNNDYFKEICAKIANVKVEKQIKKKIRREMVQKKMKKQLQELRESGENKVKIKELEHEIWRF